MRFEKSYPWELASRCAKFCKILSHRYGMYVKQEQHDKTNKTNWASSQSDQSSLSDSRFESLVTHKVHSKDSDQTGFSTHAIL